MDSYLYRGTKINGVEAENLTSEKVTLGKCSATAQFTVENVYEKNTINVSVTKEWYDGDDEDRPVAVVVKLLANGVDLNMPATLISDRNGKWFYEWCDLPKYDLKTGNPIIYSVEEVLEEDSKYKAEYINRKAQE